MRKMIMMAIAGFIWKKIQAKVNKQTYSGTTSSRRNCWIRRGLTPRPARLLRANRRVDRARPGFRSSLSFQSNQSDLHFSQQQVKSPHQISHLQ